MARLPLLATQSCRLAQNSWNNEIPGSRTEERREFDCPAFASSNYVICLSPYFGIPHGNHTPSVQTISNMVIKNAEKYAYIVQIINKTLG